MAAVEEAAAENADDDGDKKKDGRKRFKDGKPVPEKDKKDKKDAGKKDDGKKAANIMDVPQTKEKVAEFCIRHNRPYSIQDILNCFQSTMRKRQCEEALDLLVAEKVITLKEYGKAKVFLANQDNFPTVDPALLDAMDDQINVRRTEYNELADKVKDLDK